MTMLPLLELALKVAIILFVALAVMPLLRSRAAAFRHWMLGAAIACALAAPVLSRFVPVWHVPIFPAAPPVVTALDRLPARAAVVVADAGAIPTDVRVQPLASRLSLASAVQMVWFTGTMFALAVLGVGFVRLARLAARATHVTEGRWVTLALEISRDSGVRRPLTLLQSAHPHWLVTWGILRPRILLPLGAESWTDERIRVVLHHELAHIRRGDWLVQLTAELLRAAHWFNPLAWVACRRLQQESELACDAAVLDRGIDGPRYAKHLLAVARELHDRRMWVPAPSMARASNLERRVRAMLDMDFNRRPLSRMSCGAAVLALLIVSMPVAGLAFGQVFSSIGGSVVDPTNAVLPGVTLALTNAQTGARYEVRSDRTGRYEFVGLAPGDYTLEVKLPGFRELRATVAVAGQNLQQDLRLQVGQLREEVVVRAGTRGSDTPGGRVAGPEPARPIPACANNQSPGGVATGGNLRPPIKLLDVRPHYPARLASEGIEGTVLLDVVIGADGNVEDVKVASSPHADLSAAAADAVRQWQFDSTLLNCVPIPVPMKVSVQFEKEKP